MMKMVDTHRLDEENEQDCRESFRTKGEMEVCVLLSDMGFVHVGHNVILQDHPSSTKGEVDLIFEYGNILLLVEVSADRHWASEKKRKFFHKWSDGPLLEELKKKIDRCSHEVRRAFFDMRPEPENQGAPEVEGIDKPGTMNKILFQGDYDRLASSTRQDAVTPKDFLGLFV